MSKRSAAGGTVVVKNRAPAPIQITAEQIVREAADRQELFPVEPVVKIQDAEEYQAYLRDRRKQYEDNIRYRREHIGTWIKYAKFEEENKEYERARSIFERALEVDHRSAELWLRYVEFELRNEFINHARNILDRAIQLLPRRDFLWYKYVYIEEMVGDIPKCRAVYERWMEWIPDDNAWLSYARFEIRCLQYDKAEAVMRRYVNTYPTAAAFIKFAKWAEFEIKNGTLARTIYEAALSELEPEELQQARLFQQFANFEERANEYDRARVIYKYAITLFKLGDNQVEQRQKSDDEEDITDQERTKRNELYQSYIIFEKKHGQKDAVEAAVLIQQRTRYKKLVEANPYDYDIWFDYIQLEENYQLSLQQETKSASGSQYEIQIAQGIVRDTYERAIANVPPKKQGKDSWRRYIYLWIYYATYEELTNHDMERAAQVYKKCIDKIIPHKQFTFSKVWILAAKLHIRRKDIISARKLLGRAIGICGKERIYTEYIHIELSLGEIDRCRILYTKYVKSMPNNSTAWCKFANFEKTVGETERCRAIYELAIRQDELDMPESVWKSYIDFEIDENEIERVRSLYKRLIEKTGGHIKVWISYAQYEITINTVEGVRTVFENAYNEFRNKYKYCIETNSGDPTSINEDRLSLLDAWKAFEKTKGSTDSIAHVEAKMPRRIKRKRMRYSTDDDNGGKRRELGWEEYFDYQFPDDTDTAAATTDDNAANTFKILEMAAKWKQQQQQQQQQMLLQDDDDDDDDSDDDDDNEE